MKSILIDAQIACVRREINMRHRVFPRWVETGKMPAESAEYQIAAMEAVLSTLEGVRAEQLAQSAPGLFDELPSLPPAA